MAFLLESQVPLAALEPSRQRLLLSVIEEYHGPIVSTVAEVLLRADRTTLAELTRLVQRDQGIMGVSRAGKTRTKVTTADVKESLLIMTQHNMVAAEMPTEKEMRRARPNGSGPGNVRMHYTLLPLEALVRTRGPLFHSHASATFSKVAGLIVDCFLRHGRRTLPDVKKELLSKAQEAARTREALANFDEDDSDGAEGAACSEVTAESIQKRFEELVMGKYIDKVPKLDLVNPTVGPEKATKPSMTFGAVSAGVGGGNKGAKGGGGAAGPNVKSKELAARQQKGAAQANARKRRILGHDSNGGGKGTDGGQGDSDSGDDQLPVEMRNMVNSIGGSSGSGGGGSADGNNRPAKRKKTANGEVSGRT
ncbi:unnamed protein product, partial [Pylaiella littoralis]